MMLPLESHHVCQVAAGRCAQRGAVLPVALIMLLIISLLAVAGMSDTTLQERMAGSLRDRDIAFQAAEASLRQGELWIENNLAQAAAALELAPVAAAAWDGATPAPTQTLGGLYSADAGVALAQAPGVHVAAPQLLRANPGETPPRYQAIYPVTARAVGATQDTVVILRSTYNPLNEN